MASISRKDKWREWEGQEKSIWPAECTRNPETDRFSKHKRSLPDADKIGPVPPRRAPKLTVTRAREKPRVVVTKLTVTHLASTFNYYFKFFTGLDNSLIPSGTRSGEVGGFLSLSSPPLHRVECE
jgi:hypothetical protein